MCQSASFIILKNGDCLHHISDSHRVILKVNNIPDKSTTPNFVACEIIPPNHNYTLPFDQWVFSIDDNYPVPDWYNESWCKQRCLETLPEWAKEHIISDNGEYNITEGTLFIVGNATPVITLSDGIIYTRDQSAPVITQSDGKIYTIDQSVPVITQFGGDIYTMGQSASVITQNGGTILAYGESTPIITQFGGKIYKFNKSRPTIRKVEN